MPEDLTPPFVSIELCEKVTRDPDGRKNLLRLLSAFIATDTDDEALRMPYMDFRCVVRATFWGARFSGVAELEIAWVAPTGSRRSLSKETQPFDGKSRDVEYLIPVTFRTRDVGEHWIEARVNGVLKGAAPFEVTFIPPAQGKAGPS